MEIGGQRCIWQPAFFWREIISVMSNGIKSRRRNLRNWRWLKPVSTLSRDLVIRRIDTVTLYHVTAMLWYHVKHKLLLNKMQSCLWRYKLPWQQESIEKHPIFWLNFRLISEKRNRWAHFFIAQKWSAGQGETRSGFRATLNFQLFKVALNPLHIIFLNFTESFILTYWLHFRNIK